MKKYLVIGNKNGMCWKEIFPIYMRGDIRFGYNEPNYMYVNNQKICMQGICRWFSNLIVEKTEFRFDLFPVEMFEKYDDVDAYNTDSIYKIPDTDNLIGVPLGVFDYKDPGYEVVGYLCNGGGGYDMGVPQVNGQIKYRRVLIKRK